MVDHLEPGSEPVTEPRRDRHTPNGPALERVGVGLGSRWLTAAGSALGVEATSVVVAERSGWLTVRGPGLVLLVGALFVILLAWAFARRSSPPPISAGACWVRSGAGAPVDLYRVATVAVRSVDAVPHLRLADPDGSIDLHLELLQSNPALWALVHHGIRHSVNRGAAVDGGTLKRLHIPEGRNMSCQ